MLPSAPPMPYALLHGHTKLLAGNAESVTGSLLYCLQDWQPTGKQERTARMGLEKSLKEGNGTVYRELVLCGYLTKHINGGNL